MWYITVIGKKKLLGLIYFILRLFPVLVLHNFYRNIFISLTPFLQKLLKKVKWLICYCSVTESRLTFCDPMDCSMPGSPVLHHLLEFAQLHFHCIGDAVHPSHPLMPSSPSALDLSQHQGLFQWVICAQQMTKILELQHHSFHWIFRVDLLKMTGLISLLSKGLLGVFFSTTVQRHQFFGILPSLQSSSHNDMWPMEDHSLDYTALCRQSNVPDFQHTV